jgi:hypothetical protein
MFDHWPHQPYTVGEVVVNENRVANALDVRDYLGDLSLRISTYGVLSTCIQSPPECTGHTRMAHHNKGMENATSTQGNTLSHMVREHKSLSTGKSCQSLHLHWEVPSEPLVMPRCLEGASKDAQVGSIKKPHYTSPNSVLLHDSRAALNMARMDPWASSCAQGRGFLPSIVGRSTHIHPQQHSRPLGRHSLAIVIVPSRHSPSFTAVLHV